MAERWINERRPEITPNPKRQNDGTGEKSPQILREGMVFFGGGWTGALEGMVISKFFTNRGESNLFYSQTGEGHSFLLS